MGRPRSTEPTLFAQLQTLLYQAKAQPLGLLIATDDPQKCRQRLYQAKYHTRDIELAEIEIRHAPPEITPPDSVGRGFLIIALRSVFEPAVQAPPAQFASRGSSLFSDDELKSMPLPEDLS